MGTYWFYYVRPLLFTKSDCLGRELTTDKVHNYTCFSEQEDYYHGLIIERCSS